MVKLLEDMLLDDVDISSEESDEEDLKYKKLLNDLHKNLGHPKRRKFSSTRTEPSAEISEYTWSSTKGKISLQDLIGSLDSSCRSVAKVKKKLREMEHKTKVLNKPLEKVQRERVERSVAYEETAKDITKWNCTIQKNREAEQLVFPIGCYKPPPVSTKNMIIEFKPQNEMEKQIWDVLHGSKHLLERKDKELTEAEERALQSVDLEDALERRRELQRTRVLQSYYEVKCHRAKKIKSKKYHRMLKKEQQKSLNKIDLETLSKENPALFRSEMEKAEQLRAKERASLRHRNSSKWAKNLITKGHKTKEDQERIREQLRISRQLTEHRDIEESDEDEGIEKDLDESFSTIELSLLQRIDMEDNPWLLGNVDTQEKITTSSDPPKEYIKLQPIRNSEIIACLHDNDDNVGVADDWEEAGKDNLKNLKERISLKVKKTKKRKGTSVKSKKNKKIDAISENEYNEDGNSSSPAITLRRICENVKLDAIGVEVNEIESNKSCDSSELSKEDKVLDICEEDESNDDEFTFDNTEQTLNINEAFANDDVIGDFIQEKKDVIEKSKPKPVDLTLPGWGDWAGPGLTVSKKKRKRFTKDNGPVPKRMDDGNVNVIINEKCNKLFVQHQVSDVPFPYSNKVEFERSIRQPIGGHWNTPSVHNKLIEPRVRIKPGVTIDPLKATRRMKKKFQRESIVK